MNPVSLLNQICQSRFGKNIETRVISVVGQSHCPKVTVEIIFPANYCGHTECLQYTAQSKKAAKEILADKILKEYFYDEAEDAGYEVSDYSEISNQIDSFE